MLFRARMIFTILLWLSVIYYRRKQKLSEESHEHQKSFHNSGCIGVGLGAVGAVVPMLPSSFFDAGSISFAKSSEKLNAGSKAQTLQKQSGGLCCRPQHDSEDKNTSYDYSYTAHERWFCNDGY